VNIDKQLSLDMRRTILLGEYMRAWGMPLYRTVTKRGDETVEAYFFPAKGDSVINRYATVGLSNCVRVDGRKVDQELFMATPYDNAGATADEVTSYLFDIMAFSLGEDIAFEVGCVFGESRLAPAAWTARAILIDEPRAEPEFLTEMHVGSQCVRLLWVVQIHKDELALILKSGIDMFDEFAQAAEWSIVDPQRDSYLAAQ